MQPTELDAAGVAAAGELYQWADGIRACYEGLQWADGIRACYEGLQWANGKSLAEAWATDERPGFLLWIAGRAGLLEPARKQQVAHAVEQLLRPWCAPALWAEVVEDAGGRPLRLAYTATWMLTKIPGFSAEQRQQACQLIRQLIQCPEQLPTGQRSTIEGI